MTSGAQPGLLSPIARTRMHGTGHERKPVYKLLFVAFACEPGRASEPGIGWNFVEEAARRGEVWVLTHSSFKKPMDAFLANRDSAHSIHPIYVHLPGLRWLWGFGIGINVYYYLWQFAAARRGKEMHRKISFDLVHHVSFQRYWMHSAGASIGAPFIFGPVGGGEIWPASLKSERTLGDRFRTLVWSMIRVVMEKDPFFRRTLRQAHAVIPSVGETVGQLRRLGVQPLPVMPSVASKPDLSKYESITPPTDVFRFISIGRLPRWKGVHLGIKAFAKAFGPKSDLCDSKVEYVIVGEGSDLGYLKRLVSDLGITHKVRFEGNLPYSKCLDHLAVSHAMLHPTIRDSGGLVFEALMLGKPVACLNLGSPYLLVGDSGGQVIEKENGAEAIVDKLANAICNWYTNPIEFRGIAENAKRRARIMSRENRGDQLEVIYEKILSARNAVSE